MTFKIAGTLIWVLYPHLRRRQADADKPAPHTVTTEDRLAT